MTATDKVARRKLSLLDLVLREIAEFDITLSVQTNSLVNGGDCFATPSDIIDIDDFANTGLSDPKCLRLPWKPATTNGGGVDEVHQVEIEMLRQRLAPCPLLQGPRTCPR